jgi:hypothetical protein
MMSLFFRCLCVFALHYMPCIILQCLLYIVSLGFGSRFSVDGSALKQSRLSKLGSLLCCVSVYNHVRCVGRAICFTVSFFDSCVIEA